MSEETAIQRATGEFTFRFVQLNNQRHSQLSAAIGVANAATDSETAETLGQAASVLTWLNSPTPGLNDKATTPENFVLLTEQFISALQKAGANGIAEAFVPVAEQLKQVWPQDRRPPSATPDALMTPHPLPMEAIRAFAAEYGDTVQKAADTLDAIQTLLPPETLRANAQSEEKAFAEQVYSGNSERERGGAGKLAEAARILRAVKDESKSEISTEEAYALTELMRELPHAQGVFKNSKNLPLHAKDGSAIASEALTQLVAQVDAASFAYWEQLNAPLRDHLQAVASGDKRNERFNAIGKV